MGQELRSLLAVGLSIAVFILWYSYFAPKPQKTENQEQRAVSGEQSAVGKQQEAAGGRQSAAGGETAKIGNLPVPGPSDTVDPQADIPAKITTIESDLYKARFTNDGGVPISWEMKRFKKSAGEKTVPVELVSAGEPVLLNSFAVPGIPARPRYNVVEATKDRIVYAWRSKDMAVTKTYQFDLNSYLMDVSVAVRNLGQNAVESGVSTEWRMVVPKEEEHGLFGFLKGPQNEFQFIYYMNGGVQHDAVVKKEGNLLWAGIEDRYFISAIVPRGHGDTAEVVSNIRPLEDGNRILETKVTVPPAVLLAGSEAVHRFSVYAGPKEMISLKAAGSSLDKAIDYGWFSFIAVPILYLLKLFYVPIHNYGIAIILLTVFVKLLLHPLSRHSMKSMKAMQQLQPKMKELKEKHKNDRERLNVETMQLFKTHKVNPMGGCLPMILQLPIYIALYKVLWNSIELYRAPFFWFYRDLSTPDPFFIMPVFLGIFMWLQQRMTPSASADPMQAKMMQIMPIMFTAFMLFLPSGLVLYILVNTVMGVAQQYMTNKDLRLRDVVRGKFS